MLPETYLRLLGQDHATYLFFSLDSWYRSYHSASKSFDRMMKTVRTYRNGHFRRSDFVKQSISLILERDLVTSTEHFMGSPSLQISPWTSQRR